MASHRCLPHPWLAAFASAERSFAVGLARRGALAMPLADVLDVFTKRFGEAVAVALSDVAVGFARDLADPPDAMRSRGLWTARS